MAWPELSSGVDTYLSFGEFFSTKCTVFCYGYCMINYVGGWRFLQNSISRVRKILARRCLVSGHSFTQACSLLASVIHAMVLVYFVSRGL